MDVAVRDIAYVLPECVLTNEALGEQYPEWDMARVAARSGVQSRAVAAPGETALDLSARACQKLFAARPGLRERVDALIVCTQTPDYVMPPNSCLLHDQLKLGEHVAAFDFNLACSGYVYGLAIARGLIVSGAATEVLLVTADTYSKLIHPQDRSARVLFGDGAAASWITSTDASEGIVDIALGTAGEKHGCFIVPAGGFRQPKSSETSQPIADESNNVRTLEHIHMDGMGILNFVVSRVPQQVNSLLERNGWRIDDVDLFVFHQASKMALDSLGRLLRIPATKMANNLAQVGNTVSASIPIAWQQAREAERSPAGSKVLLCGFGVGLSWGTALYQA
jgi:3-oxoacyl-[acyl-carrier-protein] synthase-3